MFALPSSSWLSHLESKSKEKSKYYTWEFSIQSRNLKITWRSPVHLLSCSDLALHLKRARTDGGELTLLLDVWLGFRCQDILSGHPLLASANKLVQEKPQNVGKIGDTLWGWRGRYLQLHLHFSCDFSSCRGAVLLKQCVHSIISFYVLLTVMLSNSVPLQNVYA